MINANKDARRSKEMNTVHLVLEYEHYDAIDSGEKTIEYRDNSPYWRTRILGKHPSGKDSKEFVTFHRGYTNETMSFKIAYLVVPRPDEVDKQIEIHLSARMHAARKKEN